MYIKIVTYQAGPSSFCTVSPPLILIRPLVAAFYPIQHVKLAVVPFSERDHADWLFSLGNHCTRRETEVTKASDQCSQEWTHTRVLIFHLHRI